MSWQIGQRVCRKEDAEQVSTIIQNDGHDVKIKWDSGRTSYYRIGEIPLSQYTDPDADLGSG
jgi:hypothetical protein